MAEAGGWRAGPPTCSPSLPGCSGPGHALDSSTGGLGSRDLGTSSTAAPGPGIPGPGRALDSSTRGPGMPSWTCCQLGKRGPHGVTAQLLCLRREGGWAGGACGRRAVPGARSRSLTKRRLQVLIQTRPLGPGPSGCPASGGWAPF